MKPRVLVVDDEPPQLEILRLILGSEGYDVAAAASGRSAPATHGPHALDVVVNHHKNPDQWGNTRHEEILRSRAPAWC